MKTEEEFSAEDLSRFLRSSIGGTEYVFKTGLTKPIDSASQWLISQYLKELSGKKEALKEFDTEEINKLSTQINKLRQDIEKNNEMLNISNNLLLQLISILNTQEAQSYFWNDSWIEAERNADEDIKNKKIRTFETSDQIIDFLRSSEK